MRKKGSFIPLYLVLLPIFFVLHHNNELFGFIPFSSTVMALLFSYVGLAICFGIFYFFARNIPLALIITFLLGVFMLFFGALLDGLKFLFPSAWITRYVVLVPLCFIVILFLGWWMKWRPVLLRRVQVYLSTLFILFIIVEVFNLGVTIFRVAKNKNLIYPLENPTAAFLPVQRDNQKPDIYFMVFDAYTNNNTLQQFWGYSNADLLNWMKSENFYVVDSGNANYNFTPFSISSTLNMDYLPADVARKGNDPLTVMKGVKSMSQNEVINFLKKENYQLKYFIPFDNQIQDVGLVHEFDNFGDKELYNQTFPARFEHDVSWNFLYGKWKPGWIKTKSVEDLPSYQNFLLRTQDVGKIVHNVKQSCDNGGQRQPQFVYAHFMITHQPHLFDSLGNPRKGKELINQRNLFDTYIQQVKYANIVIREIVEYIKMHNRKNTVIIIEGDHGFRDFKGSMTHYQFPNLNAIYFPDHNYNSLYSQMSPVNTFRIVFNHYFDQNLPLKKDSTVIVNF